MLFLRSRARPPLASQIRRRILRNLPIRTEISSQQCPAERSSLFSPFLRRRPVRVRVVQEILVLFHLAEVEDVVREYAESSDRGFVIEEFVTLVEEPLTDGRDVHVILQLLVTDRSV